WLTGGGGTPPEELRQMQRAIRERVPVFHWMLEFPEIFYADRPDPLDGGRVNHAAFIDAFVGNPPFAGKNQITESGEEGYLDWLKTIHTGAHVELDRITFCLLVMRQRPAQPNGTPCKAPRFELKWIREEVSRQPGVVIRYDLLAFGGHWTFA